MDMDEAWGHECYSPRHGDEVCWPRSHSGRNYERFGSCNGHEARLSKPSIWVLLWRRIVKKQRRSRMFHCSSTSSSSSSMRFSYDPYSYSQNFDQGLIWADPDDLSRSFSARFAVPSRVFEKNGLGLMV